MRIAAEREQYHLPYLDQLITDHTDLVRSVEELRAYIGAMPHSLHPSDARLNEFVRQHGFPEPFSCVGCECPTHIDKALCRVRPAPGNPDVVVFCNECCDEAIKLVVRDISGFLNREAAKMALQALALAVAVGVVGYCAFAGG